MDNKIMEILKDALNINIVFKVTEFDALVSLAQENFVRVISRTV